MPLYYLYRFLNGSGDIIYVGKTYDLNKRIDKQHFGSSGHLPVYCYEETITVEYSEVANETDQSIYEIYFINKYRPKYNTQYLFDDSKTLIRLPDLEWRIYKNIVKTNNKDTGSRTITEKIFIDLADRKAILKDFLELDHKIRESSAFVKNKVKEKWHYLLLGAITDNPYTITKYEYENMYYEIEKCLDNLLEFSSEIVDSA